MPRKPRQILPFRIPFFRIFYSSTYTTIYIITLCIIAITPVSLIWQAVQENADQYIVMIGGTYLLTALTAIFIYASRLFTNRTVLAGVGKAYIPIERGEVGSSVRKMIVKQLERSAIIAWESRPRDLLGEILRAEKSGMLPPETMSVGRDDYTVGREIPIDPAVRPWGDVQHAGWSSPEQKDDESMPNLQFAPVVTELPNLIEARAVSLAPPDPTSTEVPPLADPVIVDALCRAEHMGMRDYLAQLSYLGLINPPEVGQSFLFQYEKARFGGLPVAGSAFKQLLLAFADLLAGMNGLDPAIIDEVRAQTADKAFMANTEDESIQVSKRRLPSSPRTPTSSAISPVTARTAPSRNITPYLQQNNSLDSVGSVIRNRTPEVAGADSQSETGSVLRHSASLDSG